MSQSQVSKITLVTFTQIPSFLLGKETHTRTRHPESLWGMTRTIHIKYVQCMISKDTHISVKIHNCHYFYLRRVKEIISHMCDLSLTDGMKLKVRLVFSEWVRPRDAHGAWNWSYKMLDSWLKYSAMTQLYPQAGKGWYFFESWGNT
jgi:hypothetical protein